LNFISAPARGSSIYIGGELLVIKESKLVAMYEFTQEDIDCLEDNIVIDIAEPIDRHENIIVVSYGGKLNYGDDYEIDIDANTITLKIKPIIGEMVQFFYYV
jgi:hypothetical protein